MLLESSFLARHPQYELLQRRLIPGILKPDPLRLDSRIGIAPSRIHGFLHVPPNLFLGDVVVTGNLADDPRGPLQFSLRVHSSISFVCVSAKGNRNANRWGEVFLLAMVVTQGKYNYSEVAMLDYKSMMDTFLRRVTLNYCLARSTGGRKHPVVGKAVALL